MSTSTTLHTHSSTPFLSTPAQPSNYTPIPQRLITDLRDTPLAIGLYALISRLFLIAHAPIPLSAADVTRYDPTLSRGALVRAFNRLLDSGWLNDTKQRGHKTSYVPTWGRVRGVIQPWNMDLPCLGRPRHVSRLPLDRNLLDVCMGKITPHPTQTASITRYITTPVLSLTDVGSYALTCESIPHETTALLLLGAVRNGRACSLPGEQQLLAIISQRSLTLDANTGKPATELTASGARRLGVAPLIAPGKTDDRSQPLFFISRDMIGALIAPMIGSMIGQDEHASISQSASISVENRSEVRSAEITWEQSDQSELKNPPPQPKSAGSGGVDSQHKKYQKPAHTQSEVEEATRKEHPSIPDTESTRVLKTINVLPEQLIELADIPIETVNAAIADGKARESVRDLAGWVVKLLRNHRDYGWKVMAPSPRADSPEALREFFAGYIAKQEAEQAEMVEEAPLEEELLTAPPSEQSARLIRLWNDVRTTMQARTTRQEFNMWIRCVDLYSLEEGIVTITAPNVMVKQVVEHRYLTILRDLFRLYLGEPIEVRLIAHSGISSDGEEPAIPETPQLAVPAPVSPQVGNQQATPAPDTKPDWISAERWQTLPAMVRASLIGSTLIDGTVQVASLSLHHLLTTRYTRELDILIAESKAV